MATARSTNGRSKLTATTASDLQAQIARLEATMTPKSKQDQARDEIFAALDKLSGEQVSDSAVVYQGDKFIIPAVLEGNLEGAVEFLDNVREAEETEFAFTRAYNFRPYDGAAAFQRAMVRAFGTQGVGRKTFSLFGSSPPQYMSVPVGYGRNMQVPWGRISFEPLKAVFDLGAGMDREHGMIFRIAVTAPKKHRRKIDGFLSLVEQELRESSIYRAQAIDCQENPGFLDLSGVDPAKVIYAKEARSQLEANFWSVLSYAHVLRKVGQPLKRAVLMEGPYGTGKTLTGVVTGQRAVANGWTFIQVRGGDDPYGALKTARMYSPSVVWIEDLDIHLAGKDREEVSRLLDALDNVNNKGAEVMVGFTTNFPNVLEKGVLRPGRIDAVIHFDALDPDGYELLIKALVPGPMLDPAIDYTQVSEAFEGYVPAFASEAIGRAIRYSLVRGEGKIAVINTEDLVHAGKGLRAQLKMLDEADETRHNTITLDSILTTKIEDVVTRSIMPDVGERLVVEKK